VCFRYADFDQQADFEWSKQPKLLLRRPEGLLRNRYTIKESAR
jgi:hypothetical protein